LKQGNAYVGYLPSKISPEKMVAVAFFFGIVTNLALLGTIAGRMGAILTESSAVTGRWA
jgi:hypothetical protein